MDDILIDAVGGKPFACGRDELARRIHDARDHLTQPFDQSRIDLVVSVSELLLTGAHRALPGFVKHFAFWTRRAAIARLATEFQKRLPTGTVARARGVVFHLPPQNVETVFLYSSILSYLVGNANVVRLPREISEEMAFVRDRFLERLAAAKDPSQMFLYYPSASDIGTAISAQSDARVVWGGDAKVALFAGVPLREGGKAIWFGDRSSFAVVRGAALADLTPQGLRDLGKRLHNDIFTFDQMGCSSPQILYVVGDRATHLPVVRELLREVAENVVGGAAASAGHVMRKMVAAFEAAAHSETEAIDWRPGALTSVISDDKPQSSDRIGGGFLDVVFVHELRALKSLVRERDQTATHFGFSSDEIKGLADLLFQTSVSRFAPAGTALDFDFVWDGYDLPSELSRLVRV